MDNKFFRFLKPYLFVLALFGMLNLYAQVPPLKPTTKGATDVSTAPQIAIVLNSGSASISLIDMQKREVIKEYPVGKEPHHLMMMPDQQYLVVANAASDNIMLINPVTGEKKQTIPHIFDPYQLGFSPDNKWFVVAGNRLNRIDLYAVKNGEIQQPPKIFKIPKTPSHIQFTSDSKIAFITLQDSNELVAIDLIDQKVLWKMPTGKLPAGIWMTPADKYLLVGLTGEDKVQVINWREQKTLKTITTGRGAHNFRPLGDGKHVFVSNRVDASISKIDMETLEKVAEIKGLPAGPDCMDITPNQKELWVSFRFSKKVGVINLENNQLEKTIWVGNSPHGVFFTPNAPWN